LCKACKDLKLISIYNKELKLNKSLFDDAKKNVETGQRTLVELADYLVKMGFVSNVYEGYVKEVERNGGNIDPDIAIIAESPSSIKSPITDNAIVEKNIEEE
jgi:hypothetical protein